MEASPRKNGNDCMTELCCGRTVTVNGAWVDKIPVIVPCYNGKSLKIHEEIVLNGLSAISIKHHKGNCSEVAEDPIRLLNKLEENGKNRKMPDEVKKHSITGLPVCLGERMKRRNSFWNMHKPELSKLTWPKNFISSVTMEEFFHHHLRSHGTFCEPLHVGIDPVLDEEIRNYTILRELVPPMVLPPDEKAVSIMEKSRSVQLNDEDLDPETMVHKSRAEFCVTAGEYTKKSLLRKSTSQTLHVPKAGLPLQRDSSLSQEELTSKTADDSNGQTLQNEGNCQKTNARIASLSGQNETSESGPGSESCRMKEDGGDPGKFRAILSPRDGGNEHSNQK